MCHWKKWFWPGVVAVALVTVLATWFRSDSIEADLTGKAREALAAAHPWAGVSMDGRDLTLTGMAPEPAAQEEALELAASAYDVRVARDASTLIPEQKPYRLSGEKTADGITLTGFVPNDAIRQSVIQTVSAAMPGIAVTDRMELARGAPAGLEELAGFGVGQFPRFSTGTFEITDTAVSVKGQALTPEDYEAALEGVSAPVPAGGSLASADILPAAVEGDYTWSATLTGPDLLLEGYAPDAETRAGIEAKAKELNPNATVINRLRIASGAPDNFGALTDFALAQLPRFSAGKASLANTALSVEGTSLGSAEFDAANAALAGELPEGMSVAAQAIEPPLVAGTYVFGAERNANVIRLTGFAPDPATRAEIVAAAEANNPGATVIDQMRIAKGVPDGVDWLAATGQATKALSDFTKGSASINGNVYSVQGETADNDAFGRAQAMVAGPMAGGLTMGTSDIGLPVASPFTWLAARAGDGAVTLSGYVPGEAVKTGNVDQAGLKFGSVPITDEQQLAAGAPRGFEAAVSVGLQSISRLEDSSAAISGTDLVVKGVALSEDARDDIALKVKNGLPPGWAGTSEITVKPAPEADPAQELTAVSCQQELSELLAANTVLFETAKAVIREDSFGLLDQISYTARACGDARIEVSGHTDSDGSDASNQTLSEARARAVVDYMTAAGVEAERLTAVGYGESRPVADNGTAEGKAKNRRIELRVING